VTPARSDTSRRESALVTNYSFDVNVLSGLAEDHLTEVSSLLRIYADRSQLARLRAEIDAILDDELELDRQVSRQKVLRDINRVIPGHRMLEDEGPGLNGAPQMHGYGHGPAGPLDKLTDQLQSLLGRVSERRCPPASRANVER